MHFRTAVATLALVASSLAPVHSQAASLFGRSADSSTQAIKGKAVKLTLVNRSSTPMTVLVNDAPVTLAVNAETQVRAALGSNIYADDHSTVKLHVTGDLSGMTVAFR